MRVEEFKREIERTIIMSFELMKTDRQIQIDR